MPYDCYLRNPIGLGSFNEARFGRVDARAMKRRAGEKHFCTQRFAAELHQKRGRNLPDGRSGNFFASRLVPQESSE
jgi:hypothetical protein